MGLTLSSPAGQTSLIFFQTVVTKNFFALETCTAAINTSDAIACLQFVGLTAHNADLKPTHAAGYKLFRESRPAAFPAAAYFSCGRAIYAFFIRPNRKFLAQLAIKSLAVLTLNKRRD
jgi:hypothetical protein